MVPNDSTTARRWLLTALAAGLLLVPACGVGVDDSASPSEEAPPDDEGTDDEPADDQTTDDEGTDDDDEVTPSTAVEVVTNLPDEAALDLQVAHPNGSSIIVRGVSFHEDRIQVTFSATNGDEDDHRLADSGMALRDDRGIVYRLSPPPGDPDVTVARQSTIEGTLVFLGRIDPDATRLTLVTNSGCCGGDNEFTNDPIIVVDGIPVTRSGGAGDGEAETDGDAAGEADPESETSAPTTAPGEDGQ